MIDYNREDQFLRQRLQKEIPILRAMIQNLYKEHCAIVKALNEKDYNTLKEHTTKLIALLLQ